MRHWTRSSTLHPSLVAMSLKLARAAEQHWLTSSSPPFTDPCIPRGRVSVLGIQTLTLLGNTRSARRSILKWHQLYRVAGTITTAVLFQDSRLSGTPPKEEIHPKVRISGCD